MISSYPEREDVLTTKGDLMAHDGTAAVRLPVGANGEVLSADSAQASGLKWVAASVLFDAITDPFLLSVR